jgi:hypothetical protein
MTASVAMLLAAPDLFSTSTDWPSRVCSHSLMIRTTVSVDPPGGNPMIQRTGRDG